MKPNYLKKYIISSYILVWVLIIFVAGSASLCEAVLFWENRVAPDSALFCPYLWYQRVVAVPLFHYDGKAHAVLHQSGNHSIAAQHFSLPDFGTDRGRIGMAWIYAGGI